MMRVLFLLLALCGGCMADEPLPRWRGFNLLERFRHDWKIGDFKEEDFQLISGFGFNYVRLPMDYRYWIKDGKWDQIDEAGLKAIDLALSYAEKHKLHLCLNLHRAPGYCVNPPKEARDLWTDPEAQKVAALHWRMFARRYKGVPNFRLSFDLVNEPSGVDGPTYAKVAAMLVAAIRAEDPGRLIVADGREGGNDPVPELLPLGLFQSGRGYKPFHLTHYKADWVEGAMNWNEPQWPSQRLNAHLYGAQKKELQAPLRLSGAFARGAGLRLRLAQVSGHAVVEIKADGRLLLSREFKPGPGPGEWKEVVYKEEWKVYQNLYELDLAAAIPAGTREVSIGIGEGDWLRFSEIGVTLPGTSERVIKSDDQSWGLKPGLQVLRPDGSPDLEKSEVYNKAWLKKEVLGPWLDLRARGAQVMIGEWGVHDKTPAAATLAFMEDMLQLMQEEDIGWALWNFRGGFGPLDSSRPGAKMEDWKGHKVDRAMLDLLRKY